MRRFLLCVLLASCTPEAQVDPIAPAHEQAIKAGVDVQAPTPELQVSEPLRSKLAGVTMPVLLPPDAELLASAKLTSGPGWYAAAMALDGADVYLKGTTLRRPRPADLPKATGPRLERSEGIVRLSFARYGVDYRLDVSCARPLEDKRCTEDAFVQGLMARLLVVAR